MELTADYYNRHSDDNADYLIDNELIGSQADESNLNLWKVKADFLYPRSRKLTWKFGASAQWITSNLRPRLLWKATVLN